MNVILKIEVQFVESGKGGAFDWLGLVESFSTKQTET